MFNISEMVNVLIKEHLRKLIKLIKVTVNENCFVIWAHFSIIIYNVYCHWLRRVREPIPVGTLKLSPVERGLFLVIPSLTLWKSRFSESTDIPYL